MVANGDRKARVAARELARTPIVDPYRGQLHDPFRPAVPQPQAADPIQNLPYLAGMRENTPGAAVAAGVIAIVLAAFAVLSGLFLIAYLTIVYAVNFADRSFYKGSDGSVFFLAALDFPLAAVGVVGAITMMSGRVAGRIHLTVFGWFMLGISMYWLNLGTATAVTVIALIVPAVSIALLALAYHARVTRWLGVLAPAQPDW
jgi:hypothetical protein